MKLQQSFYLKKESKKKKSNPLHLHHFEKKIFSQNGEDGILDEIFNRIKTTNKYFVEFGVEDATECNARNLLENQGWKGLWIDGSEENCLAAQKRYIHLPVTIIPSFITRDNISTTFKRNNVPEELDLLSIDIDGNDYWIWKALSQYSPRVLMIEYNASMGAQRNWVMPYNSKHVFDGTRYYGASLKSLVALGLCLGYRLVCCDSMGVNAFFIREDLLTKDFQSPLDSSKAHYCSPKYSGYYFGHPRWRPKSKVKW